jgi:formate/nitrite transporter FocA (FNT family)
MLMAEGDSSDVESDRAPSLDALIPAEMAARAEQTGLKKVRMDAVSLIVLAVLAGAFISLGAVFSTTVVAGAAEVPYGVRQLLAGTVFSLGLVLVGGAELFTGNSLIVMAWASGKVSTSSLLKNWTLVYAGNLPASRTPVTTCVTAANINSASTSELRYTSRKAFCI